MPTNWGSRHFTSASSEYISLGSSAGSSLNVTGGNITVSAWVYHDSISAAVRAYVSRWDDANGVAGNKLFSYLLSTDGASPSHFLFATGNGGQTSDTIITGTTTVSTGQWYHVCGVKAGSGVNATKLYVNGVQDQQGTSTLTTASNTTSTYLGANANTAGATNPHSFMDGRLGDCAVWNVGLSASEVLALSKGARPNTIRSASLQAWWPLDGLQSPEEDLSGKANNGTLTGTTPAFGPPYAPLTPRWPQVSRAVIAAVTKKRRAFNQPLPW